MAIRKCGRVRIQCKLVPASHMPHGEQYKCVLSIDGRRVTTQYVGAPRHLTHALDSQAAYSDAARAAISFALDEGKLSTNDVNLGAEDLTPAVVVDAQRKQAMAPAAPPTTPRGMSRVPLYLAGALGGTVLLLWLGAEASAHFGRR